MKIPLISVREVTLLLAAIALLAVLGIATATPKQFSSVELKFTDASSGGLAIVPASCPSYPHYGGDCTAQVEDQGSGDSVCTPHNVCLGGANVINSCTGGVVQVCQWGCVGGACLPPPPTYVSFVARLPNGTTFNADGHLRAQPVLVRSGDPTQLYWNVANVANCTVTGTNGDSFSGASSNESGITSGPITISTVFTLNCNSLTGVTPPSITGSVTVNIAPVFQEL